jgi:DNA-binding NarL/FixJ family response regulator
MNAESNRIKLVLVEDHDDFRISMNFLLNSNPDLFCACFSKAEDALNYVKSSCPDVVIMDINLPGMSGIECTHLIRSACPQTQVMMCTVHEDDEKIFDALKAGASGYMLKRASINEIFDAIQQVYHGGSPMSPSIARKVVASFRPDNKQADLAATLSPRENEILDHLAQGYRIKEIADQLFVSVNTIRTHIRHIYEKLQVQSRVEALNKTGKSRY